MEDLFNKDCSRLLKKKLWLFDMDGTIYNEDNLFDGTLQLLNKIIDLGGKYIFITNNSSKSVNDYIEKANVEIKKNYAVPRRTLIKEEVILNVIILIFTLQHKLQLIY